jgi:GNAT superfamily N-acetyltransferase
MLTEAERVLHDRTRLACEAAVDAGLPGTFEAWEEDGLLGGSATPPEHRGKGAQARLLLHGLGIAAREGHRFAVATAAEGSPSLSNMRRTGFHVHVRQAWR